MARNSSSSSSTNQERASALTYLTKQKESWGVPSCSAPRTSIKGSIRYGEETMNGCSVQSSLDGSTDPARRVAREENTEKLILAAGVPSTSPIRPGGHCHCGREFYSVHAPDAKPYMLAPCGHTLCAGCYRTLGTTGASATAPSSCVDGGTTTWTCPYCSSRVDRMLINRAVMDLLGSSPAASLTKQQSKVGMSASMRGVYVDEAHTMALDSAVPPEAVALIKGSAQVEQYARKYFRVKRAATAIQDELNRTEQEVHEWSRSLQTQEIVLERLRCEHKALEAQRVEIELECRVLQEQVTSEQERLHTIQEQYGKREQRLGELLGAASKTMEEMQRARFILMELCPALETIISGDDPQ